MSIIRGNKKKFFEESYADYVGEEVKPYVDKAYTAGTELQQEESTQHGAITSSSKPAPQLKSSKKVRWWRKLAALFNTAL